MKWGNVTMEKVMEVYPHHRQVVDDFVKDGKIIAIGAFANVNDGSMAVFNYKADAEAFAEKDPFVIEGIVGKLTIKEWQEILL